MQSQTIPQNLVLIISLSIALPSTCLMVGRHGHSNTASFNEHRLATQDSDCPSMFVAVFSRRDAVKTREKLRSLWVGAGTIFDSESSAGSADSAMDEYNQAVKQGWPSLQANFALCTEDGSTPKDLQEESDKYGDLLFLDCEEGYGHGLLTRKTLAAMEAFRDQGYQHQLFMKVDDDTFVARGRLCDVVRSGTDNANLEDSYMGVITPKDPSTPAKPHRDKSSQFYEPEDVYPNATYPPSMEGGPGYIIGRRLLKRMLDSGIPQKHMIWTEDKAVGVWMQLLEDAGTDVHWLNIDGTDGYSRWKDHGTWGNYPYTLRHHLTPVQISCLSKLDAANDPKAFVDACFQF